VKKLSLPSWQREQLSGWVLALRGAAPLTQAMRREMADFLLRLDPDHPMDEAPQMRRPRGAPVKWPEWQLAKTASRIVDLKGTTPSRAVDALLAHIAKGHGRAMPAQDGLRGTLVSMVKKIQAGARTPADVLVVHDEAIALIWPSRPGRTSSAGK